MYQKELDINGPLGSLGKCMYIVVFFVRPDQEIPPDYLL